MVKLTVRFSAAALCLMLLLSMCACTVPEKGTVIRALADIGGEEPQTSAPAPSTYPPGTPENVELLPPYRYGGGFPDTFLISPSFLLACGADGYAGQLPYLAWKEEGSELYTMLFLYGPAETLSLQNGQTSACYRMVELQLSASELLCFLLGKPCEVKYLRGTYFYAQDLIRLYQQMRALANEYSLQPREDVTQPADFYMGWMQYTETGFPYLETYSLSAARKTEYQGAMQLLEEWQTRYWG